jgi:NAD(P)-dependent dehydrogenase (short-subunit alcohol dehydrogenase family)
VQGRTVVITGGNSGIGKEAAVALAGMGAHVAITARNPQKGEAARAEIVERSGSREVEVVPLDLASLDSIRESAATMLERFPTVDVLINNAGGTLSKRQTTRDGFEMTFGVNHLGHFLLTNLLLDRLVASAPARVITVASGAHLGARGGIPFDDLQSEHGRYRGFHVYCRSKLANVMFAAELARRVDPAQVTSNSMHPGYVHTNFAREGDTGMMGWLSHVFGRPSDVAGVTGQYFYKRAVAKTSSWAQDPAAAKHLWEVSEQLVGLTPAV